MTRSGLFGRLGVAGSVGLLAVLAGSGVLLAPANVSAVDNPTITVTIGGTTADRTQTLKPTRTVGVASVISVPVTASFTNTSSYSMGVSLDCSGKAAACASSSALIGKTTNTPLNGVSTATTQANLVGANAWGFHADTTGTANVDSSWTYAKVPTTANSTNIIANTNGTNKDGLTNGSGSKTIKLHFAAGVNGDQASDEYVGNILVTVVAQPIDVFTWSITYAGNGATSGVPATQSGTSPDGVETVNQTVSSTEPTRNGYTFKEWKDQNNESYAPGAAIALTASYNNVTLTAQWEEIKVLQNGMNMQDVTAAQCDTMTTGQTVNLVDNRGPKYSYIVGKLADGKCWMLQNLALPGGITINNTNSHLTGTVTSYTLPVSSTTFESKTDGRMYNGSHIDNTADSMSNTGAYYNLVAATAGIGGTSSGYVPSDICPKGWRLPTGGSNSEFVNLAKQYGGTGSNQDPSIKYGSAFSNAFKVALVGSYSDGNLTSNTVYYLSSAITSNDNYFLYFNTSEGYPQGSASYTYFQSSRSVRCVLGL